MSKLFPKNLSRRERQIMDIVYQHERCTAQEIADALPDPPTYSAVRGLLRVLLEKGHLRHEKQGARYVYIPTQPRPAAAQSALRQVLHTFFGGSLENAVASLLADADTRLSEPELERLALLIAQAQTGGSEDIKSEEAGSKEQDHDAKSQSEEV